MTPMFDFLGLFTNVRMVAASVLLALGGCLNTGCATTDAQGNPKDHAQAMQYLQDGNFKGSINLEVGGSPLSAGTKTTFFLGPENTTFRASGEVDFGNSKPPVTP